MRPQPSDGSDEFRLLIKLARIVRKYYDRKDGQGSTLAGYCFTASRQLFMLAKDCGIPVKMGLAACHAFILYGNTVVDVTATQFGKRRKVLVADLDTLSEERPWGERAWELRHRHSNLAGANRTWGGRCDSKYKEERKEIQNLARKAGIL